jgi:CxxC motif-containing protein (DUF1111 family)
VVGGFQPRSALQGSDGHLSAVHHPDRSYARRAQSGRYPDSRPTRKTAGEQSHRRPYPGDRLAIVEPGRDLFTKSFKLEDGLGPDYNAPSCVTCHKTPGPGGSGGDDASVDWIYQGAQDALGSPGVRFRLDANGRVSTTFRRASVLRRPPPLFGIGELEAIADEELRRRSDPFDADGDGISGRLPLRQGCVGRLGWQSTTCDIESFVIWALSEELGILTAPERRREISEDDVAVLVAYVRQLPPPKSVGSSAGDKLFDRVLCSSCHVPVTGVARTGGTAMPVRAYTDLLLHEMGTGPRAGERDSRTEFRTPPLWGIAATGPPYLHDGSAKTLEDAILRHGGEATDSRDRYVALTRRLKQELLQFVATR